MSFTDGIGAFATGWMIADTLGWGKKGEKSTNRNNRVFKIGRKIGNKPKEGAFSEIADQLQDGDTIVLTSDVIDSVAIKAAVLIEGQGHTIFVESGEGGLNLFNHCYIRECHFVLEENSNGIRIRREGCELNLEKCTFEHLKAENANQSIQMEYPLNQIILDYSELDYGFINAKKVRGQAFKIGNGAFPTSYIAVKVNNSWSAADIDLTRLDAVHTSLGVNGKIKNFNSLGVGISTYAKALELENYSMDFSLDPGQLLTGNIILGINMGGIISIKHVVSKDFTEQELARFAKSGKLFNINPKNNTNEISISGDWSIRTRWGNTIYSGQVHLINYKDINMWYLKEEKAYLSWKNTTFKYKKTFVPKPKPKTAQDKLDEMIGLSEVKKKVKAYIAGSIVNKKRKELGQPVSDSSLHLIFEGAAGTGKTQVARLLAQVLFDNGIIKKASLKEVTAKDMLGEYTGQTSPKTHNLIMEARGGVLFIDEAYELDPGTGGSDGYKREALTTLVKDMDDYRSDLIVIMAGYTEDMKKLLEANSGLPSRFVNKINFADYSDEELIGIAKLQLTQKEQKLDADAEEELKSYIRKAKAVNQVDGNGRWIRNVLQFISEARDVRIVADGTINSNPELLNLIKLVDVQEGIMNFK